VLPCLQYQKLQEAVSMLVCYSSASMPSVSSMCFPSGAMLQQPSSMPQVAVVSSPIEVGTLGGRGPSLQAPQSIVVVNPSLGFVS
jgi:hypothetical protein